MLRSVLGLRPYWRRNFALPVYGTDAECLKHGGELSDKKHAVVFRPRSTYTFLHTRSMRRYGGAIQPSRRKDVER
jgi:hypothetical protein